MPEWLLWFTHFENSKIVALLLFFSTFCGILIYVFTGKERSRRLESYKYMPLQEDDEESDAADGEVADNERNKA
ncbi:MAG: cbb3-type cytochrome c oxidase subunit 3 [Thiogranum sp.]|nr:cbb3-type cytochrome c oxidase subunit 3 [Thiogranum sp.]